MKGKRIEAVKAWGRERVCKWPYLIVLGENSASMASLNRPHTPTTDYKAVRVRILREADYRRLLKAAKGTAKP